MYYINVKIATYVLIKFLLLSMIHDITVFCLDGCYVQNAYILPRTKTVDELHKFWSSGRNGD